MRSVKPSPRTRRWIAMSLGILGAFALGLLMRADRSAPRAPADPAAREQAEVASFWTCSMHPQVRQPQFGRCPICGMDLIAVESDASAAGMTAHAEREITLSPRARKLAEVEVAPATRSRAASELRLVGKIDYNEALLAHITARVPGRLERLHVDYTGVAVRAGAPLVDLYSPELLSAQEELLQAAASARETRDATAESTLAAVRDRLRLWGLTDVQIAEIERRERVADEITIHAPLSGIVIRKEALPGMYVETGTLLYAIADLSQVWVRLEAYESDLAWIAEGQEVEFTTEAYPGEVFRGRVAFIDPLLDARTRTVRVRVDAANADGRLKPEMFVRATLRGRDLWDAPGASRAGSIVIPASAPLVTGTRAVVYVQKAGDPGTYEGREVVLGPRAGGHYVVREGLVEGELVVVNGAFKIDSAMQIRARPSMMSAGDAAPSPHDHSSASPEPTGDSTPSLDAVLAGYFEIHRALSRDEPAPAREAARQLAETVRRESRATPGGETAEARSASLVELQGPVQQIAGATTIEDLRAAFAPLSAALARLLAESGAATRRPILRFHCPMAFAGRGADWLQDHAGVENPYYGAAMYRCGSELGPARPAPRQP